MQNSNMKPESAYSKKKKKKPSLWLPLSPILISLSAACSVSCTSSSIALNGPGQRQGHRELDEDL